MNNEKMLKNVIKHEEEIPQLRSQLETKANKDVASFYWIPKTINSVKDDNIHINTCTYQDILNLWENIRELDNKYVTRTLLGKDSTDTYDIYKYEFTPKNPTKTLFITCGLHGSEKTACYTMYRFFKELVKSWDNNQLTELKSTCKLIVIPVVNPYGFNANTRQNGRGVNLNRNFDFNWDLNADSDKGTSVFSEKESQYIRDILLSGDIHSFIDYHNTGGNQTYFRTILPKGTYYEDIYMNMYYFITRGLDNTGGIDKVEYADYPSAPNYAYSKLKIPSSNPEFDDVKFGGIYSEFSLTKNLEWNANILLKHSKMIKKTDSNGGVKIIEKTYTRTSYPLEIKNIGTIGSTLYVENPLMQYELIPDFDGMVNVDYSIVCMNPTEGSATAFMPRIWQEHGLDITKLQESYKGIDRWEVYYEGNKRTPVNLFATMPIKKGEKLHIGLQHYTTIGVTTIYRCRMRITLIPSLAKPRAISIEQNTDTSVVRYEI